MEWEKVIISIFKLSSKRNLGEFVWFEDLTPWSFPWSPEPVILSSEIASRKSPKPILLFLSKNLNDGKWEGGVLGRDVKDAF